MGSLKVGHDWATSLSFFTFLHWRKKWQPTPVFLPGKSQGRGSLVGCSPCVAKGRTRLSDFTFPFHFHALEKEMATHPSVLAWRIPGTGEPGGLPSMGSHRVRHDWSDLAVWLHSGGGFGNPLQYSCLENPHGQRSLADYNPWGCKESDTTELLSIEHDYII